MDAERQQTLQRQLDGDLELSSNSSPDLPSDDDDDDVEGVKTPTTTATGRPKPRTPGRRSAAPTIIAVDPWKTPVVVGLPPAASSAAAGFTPPRSFRPVAINNSHTQTFWFRVSSSSSSST